MIDLLRFYWDWFLFDTLLWTGALLALVMLLRRPVARYFGAGAAYALWFLPLARLLIPPFTLPSWMRPLAQTTQELEPVVAFDPELAGLPLADPTFAAPDFAAASAAPVDFLTPVLLLWLGGALVMLVRRFWLYFELRRELLDDARPVGEVGSIRLIETPAISGPMAFGVIDRVIALPAGFMASRARVQRDLAIEHELAHHRGGDLLVNMLVQPLFALHWFNPLGHLAWRALRRDQEAYCDARVVAARPREVRAAYAGIIADFARLPAHAPRPALAAPMACPVLGDKSIIHRLRSLSMSDISPRRRLLGRSALATAFLAVPLTATICYAEGAPSVFVASAQAAEPEPEIDLWTEQEEQQLEDEMAEAEIEAEADLVEARADIAEAEAELDEARDKVSAILAEVARGDDASLAKRKIRYNGKSWAQMSAAERTAFQAEMRKVERSFGENGELRMQMRELSREFAEDGRVQREIRMAMAEAREAQVRAVAMAPRVPPVGRVSAVAAPRVVEECRDEEAPVVTETDGEGRTVMYVCERAGERIALRAIHQARSAIAAEPSLSAEARAEALRELDREIADLERGK